MSMQPNMQLWARTAADYNVAMDTNIDLNIALRKLHQLQAEDGDLGALYWRQVSDLLKEAANYRDRALAAEAKLRKIEALVKAKG